MKNIIFLIILFISLCFLIYGKAKKHKRVTDIGSAGILFLVIVAIVDLMDFI